MGVGRLPSSITLADINGDGSLDMLTPSGDGARTVSVRLNDGTGIYTSTTDLVFPDPTRAIVAGDMDGDGDQDLLVITAGPTSSDSRLYTYLNNGAGRFAVFATATFTNGFLTSPRLGDMDGDGDLDLVMNNNGALDIRRNNGSGALLGGFSGYLGISMGALAVGDVDNDGDLDVTTLNAGTRAVSLLNDGSGTFSLGPATPVLGQYITVFAQGDFDNDGDLDLAFIDLDTNTLFTRLNNGSGTFGAGTVLTVPSRPEFMTPADVDADGDLYLLVVTTNNKQVNLCLNNGRGVFTAGPATLLDSDSVGPIEAGDVDGDGDLDFAVRYDASYVAVRRNGGNPTSTFAITGLGPVRHALAAPRNSNVTATFSEALSSGAATTGALRVFTESTGRKVGVATVAGSTLLFDPAADFWPGEKVTVSLSKAVRTATGNALLQPYLWEFVAAGARASGNFSTGTSFATGGYPLNVRLTDLNLDHNLDVVVSYGGYPITVLMNRGGGAFAPPAQLIVGGAPVAAADLEVADMDNDGDPDLVVGQGWGNVYVLRNDGHGVFTQASLLNQDTETATNLTVGDVDGDGDIDVLQTDRTNGSGTYLRVNDGQGNLSGNYQISNTGRGITLADIDNDGDLDLLTSSESYTLSISFNDGNGVFSRMPTVASVGYWFDHIPLADMDKDGDLDLVVPNAYGAGNRIWRNPGNGSFTFANSYITMPSPYMTITPADVDGDGDMDLVGSGNSVWVQLNNGTGGFTSGTTVLPGNNCVYSALGDLDNDGDIDLVAVNEYAIYVRYNANQPTATSAAQAKLSFQVWPNPAGTTGSVRVALPAPAAAGMLNAYTLTGQLVRQQAFRGATTDFSTQGLTPGLYMLTVEQPNQPALRQQLVVQ